MSVYILYKTHTQAYWEISYLLCTQTGQVITSHTKNCFQLSFFFSFGAHFTLKEKSHLVPSFLFSFQLKTKPETKQKKLCWMWSFHFYVVDTRFFFFSFKDDNERKLIRFSRKIITKGEIIRCDRDAVKTWNGVRPSSCRSTYWPRCIPLFRKKKFSFFVCVCLSQRGGPPHHQPPQKKRDEWLLLLLYKTENPGRLS